MNWVPPTSPVRRRNHNLLQLPEPEVKFDLILVLTTRSSKQSSTPTDFFHQLPQPLSVDQGVVKKKTKEPQLVEAEARISRNEPKRQSRKWRVRPGSKRMEKTQRQKLRLEALETQHFQLDSRRQKTSIRATLQTKRTTSYFRRIREDETNATSAKPNRANAVARRCQKSE